MGTGCEVDLSDAMEGMLPRAVRYLFKNFQDARDKAEDAVRVEETEGLFAE